MLLVINMEIMAKLELVIFYWAEDLNKYSKVIEQLLFEGWEVAEDTPYSDQKGRIYKYEVKLIRDVSE